VLRTEFEFTLPRGYVDEQGNLHRRGTMRLATALDEVDLLRDERVRANEAYLAILLLARVITSLGDRRAIGPAVIERLFAVDFAYLQELYLRVNDAEPELVETQCPDCGRRFALDLTGVLSDE
jgi:hypothetical protein